MKGKIKRSCKKEIEYYARKKCFFKSFQCYLTHVRQTNNGCTAVVDKKAYLPLWQQSSNENDIVISIPFILLVDDKHTC